MIEYNCCKNYGVLFCIMCLMRAVPLAAGSQYHWFESADTAFLRYAGLVSVPQTLGSYIPGLAQGL